MNSFTIVQTPEQTQRAVSVHRHAELRSIRLAKSKGVAERPEEALQEALELAISVKSRVVEVPVDSIGIEVYFRLAAVEVKAKTKVEAFAVECTYQLTYELREAFIPTNEELKAFKDGNAIFNAWPYCREYVQSTVARMGFPPPTLPFLRVQTATAKRKRVPTKTIAGK